MFSKYFQLLFFFYIIFSMIWYRPAVSFSTIRSLPGFSGPLPFNLQTGYIGVGDVEFFYYFIESERNPAEDPLMLWLTGGPGCSALSGLFFEIGPLQFNMVEYNGSLPTFALNPYSWTKVANIIFLDAPVGTGFSYSRTYPGFKSGDTRFANDAYNFLRKWLESHPKFITSSVYIAGDSYSGMIVPIIARLISDGIEDCDVPAINLKGYLLGNPGTDRKVVLNSKIAFYHRTALISDELYESAKRNCKEEYVEVDIGNIKCAKDLQAISENYNGYLCKVWANDINVQEALHIRKGTIREWVRCNKSLLYDKDVGSTTGYHLYLNTKGYRALVYSGDHDSSVPYIGTEYWIKSLNFSVVDEWRPWFVDGQVAGYSREYENDFTFATVKGGGHTAPEYNPKECFAMFKRWISLEPL